MIVKVCIILLNIYYCSIDCLIGKWGIECNQTCSDNCGGKGRIKSCDPVDGTCVCNDCWLLEGNMCTKGNYRLNLIFNIIHNVIVAGNMTGYQCFVDYLKSITKVHTVYVSKTSYYVI